MILKHFHCYTLCHSGSFNLPVITSFRFSHWVATSEEISSFFCTKLKQNCGSWYLEAYGWTEIKSSRRLWHYLFSRNTLKTDANRTRDVLLWFPMVLNAALYTGQFNDMTWGVSLGHTGCKIFNNCITLNLQELISHGNPFCNFKWIQR